VIIEMIVVAEVVALAWCFLLAYLIAREADE
jgi:hypothetical protein